MTRFKSSAFLATVVLGVALAATACVGDKITAVDFPQLPATALSLIKVQPQASIIAVGGTQQLTPVGFSYAGQPVTAFDSVWYVFKTPADSTRLSISKTGVVTGLAGGGANILVDVIAFKDGAVRGDEVPVQVTATSQSGLTLSIQPVAPDSAKLAAGTVKTITPVVRNPTTGASVSNPAVRYLIKGSDSSRIDVFRGPVSFNFGNGGVDVINPVNALFPSIAVNQIVAISGTGTAWIYASITAYGQVLQDSVKYTLSYPFAKTLSTTKINLAIANFYAGQAVTLAPGATVTFQNGIASTDPLTITYTFDNPAGATAATPASTIGGSSGNVTTLTGGHVSVD